MASRIDRNTDCLLYLGGPSDLVVMRLTFPFGFWPKRHLVLFLPALEAVQICSSWIRYYAVRMPMRQPLTRKDSLDLLCYYTLLTFGVSPPTFSGNLEQILRQKLLDPGTLTLERTSRDSLM